MENKEEILKSCTDLLQKMDEKELKGFEALLKEASVQKKITNEFFVNWIKIVCEMHEYEIKIIYLFLLKGANIRSLAKAFVGKEPPKKEYDKFHRQINSCLDSLHWKVKENEFLEELFLTNPIDQKHKKLFL